MTWKTYVAMSGATVVAGWLASTSPEPVSVPPTARPRALQTPAPVVAASDIQEQAERLRARLQVERSYTAPQRDPFRFADRAAIEQPEARAASPDRGPIEAPVEPVPAGPRVSLSGIAEDMTPGGPQRTAILSSPAGILMVREGEDVLGAYRVLRIESEAVELSVLADGTVRRLALR